MALQTAVYRDGYSYTEDVIAMGKETIAKSRALFDRLKQAGIIIAGEYDDRQWVMSNDVKKSAVISFQLDEVHFVRQISEKLNCTLSDYQQAMRIVVTSRFGYAIKTLQISSTVMRNFADHLDVPKDYDRAQLLADLLTLLPGESDYRTEVLQQIDDISPLRSAGQEQRQLSCYRSYLRFLDLLDSFWESASASERILYFPIWFWYKITGILPLRPTECVLTPRRCVRKEGGQYFLTVRRTRPKGTVRGVGIAWRKTT